MVLAQAPTPIITDPRGYMTAVHGGVGVGKTSFGEQIDGHYFFITEAGTEGVEVFGDLIFSWKDFIAKAKEVIEAKKAGFKDQRTITTIVVDTLENLFGYAATEVCATQTFVEKGVAHRFTKIDDVPFGKGYKAAFTLMLRNLEQLRLHGFGMLLLSHTKERIVKWAGNDMTHYGFNLPPSVALAVEGACGAIAHFDIEETVERDTENNVVKVEQARWMYWQPTFLRTAKHRLKGFPEKLSLPINKGWETYSNAFAETVENLRIAKLETLKAAATLHPVTVVITNGDGSVTKSESVS